MARARRSADEGGLFNLPAGRRGRVETAVNKAIMAARKQNLVDDLDGALITLARAQARSVDVAEAARDVWALARVGGELRDSLIRLRLDPTSRGAFRDDVGGFLADLAKPTPGDPTSAA